MGTIKLDLKTLAALSFLTHPWVSHPFESVLLSHYIEIKSANHNHKKLWFPGTKIWADGLHCMAAWPSKNHCTSGHSTRLWFWEFSLRLPDLTYDSTDLQADIIRPFQIATHCQWERATHQYNSKPAWHHGMSSIWLYMQTCTNSSNISIISCGKTREWNGADKLAYVGNCVNRCTA